MGTSGTSSGSSSGTPLVPTWLENEPLGLLPCSDALVMQQQDDIGGNGNPAAQPDSEDNGKEFPAIPPPQAERFRGARTNFSRFVGSGGSNVRSLRRAVRDYVRSGTGGSRNAVRRMGASRSAASNALGVFRGIQRDGIQATLQRLNLQKLSGRKIQDVFIGFTEVICRDGGSVDEAIARDAWLETIAELDQFGIDDFDALSHEATQEIFLSFLGHTIESRLYQEIGINGFRFSEGLDDIDGFDRQFRDYIQRTVRDSFTSDFEKLSNMSDEDIREIVDKTYLEAWDLLQQLGDREG